MAGRPRRGQVEALGRLGKASRFNDLRENLQCGEAIHAAYYAEYRDYVLRY
jgi:hypothetical protein